MVLQKVKFLNTRMYRFYTKSMKPIILEIQNLKAQMYLCRVIKLHFCRESMYFSSLFSYDICSLQNQFRFIVFESIGFQQIQIWKTLSLGVGYLRVD